MQSQPSEPLFPKMPQPPLPPPQKQSSKIIQIQELEFPLQSLSMQCVAAKSLMWLASLIFIYSLSYVLCSSQFPVFQKRCSEMQYKIYHFT